MEVCDGGVWQWSCVVVVVFGNGGVWWWCVAVEVCDAWGCLAVEVFGSGGMWWWWRCVVVVFGSGCGVWHWRCVVGCLAVEVCGAWGCLAVEVVLDSGGVWWGCLAVESLAVGVFGSSGMRLWCVAVEVCCGGVATLYLFHMALRTFTDETTAMHVQLSQASSNLVIEHWASSVYHYSQSFSTVNHSATC